MNKNKIIIYLAELVHNGLGLSINTVPLGIGVVGAYCKKIYGDEIDLQLFRRFEDLYKAIKSKPPHIIALGCYAWNENLTFALTKIVRELCPATLIVLGGANISFKGKDLVTEYSREYDLAMLKQHPEIDIIVHGDGEIPFSNIVESFITFADRVKTKNHLVDGCTALSEGNLLSGKNISPIHDLDQIPSPYLMGLYKVFLEQFQLVPQIETVRGCPYECTYCTIGGNLNKLRKHSFEYTKEEILFLKGNSPTRLLRIADSNWGILKSDIKLAEYIQKLHESTGYPTSLRVYYAEKGPFENVKKMSGKLKYLLPLNISFQTLTEEVLHNVKRKNMPLDKVKKLVKFAYENDILVSTELISGLPGESYESFRQMFLKVINLGFDSIMLGSLYLIKGSELNKYKARALYNFKTMYSLIGKDVTKVNSKYIFDVDEVVVESSSMSLDDFWELHKFRLFAFMCYGSAFLKEIIMHCKNFNISLLDIYDELINNPERYLFLNKIISEYIENVKTKYFKSLDKLEVALSESIDEYGNVDKFSIPKDFLAATGTVLNSKNKSIFIFDVVSAACSVYNEKQKGKDYQKFREVLDILRDLTFDIIISPIEDVEQEIIKECSYDLLAWASEGYKKKLSNYVLDYPIELSLKVRNIGENRYLFNNAREWTDADKYEYYFTTMVSSNMRRIISSVK